MTDHGLDTPENPGGLVLIAHSLHDLWCEHQSRVKAAGLLNPGGHRRALRERGEVAPHTSRCRRSRSGESSTIPRSTGSARSPARRVASVIPRSPSASPTNALVPSTGDPGATGDGPLPRRRRANTLRRRPLTVRAFTGQVLFAGVAARVRRASATDQSRRALRAAGTVPGRRSTRPCQNAPTARRGST